MIAALIGIGLIAGVAWFLPAAFVAAYATQKLAIVREERHLDHRLGRIADVLAQGDDQLARQRRRMDGPRIRVRLVLRRMHAALESEEFAAHAGFTRRASAR